MLPPCSDLVNWLPRLAQINRVEKIETQNSYTHCTAHATSFPTICIHDIIKRIVRVAKHGTVLFFLITSPVVEVFWSFLFCPSFMHFPTKRFSYVRPPASYQRAEPPKGSRLNLPGGVTKEVMESWVQGETVLCFCCLASLWLFYGILGLFFVFWFSLFVVSLRSALIYAIITISFAIAIAFHSRLRRLRTLRLWPSSCREMFILTLIRDTIRIKPTRLLFKFLFIFFYPMPRRCRCTSTLTAYISLASSHFISLGHSDILCQTIFRTIDSMKMLKNF